ncbi:hypothetical protein Fmac_025604 [Flemingia macrophylla]|uniref:Uncharacterized protein n=1 Tax=Flemingia macrophylla TaxID=520843 RepID=A0ABD1LSP2_9FABA
MVLLSPSKQALSCFSYTQPRLNFSSLKYRIDVPRGLTLRNIFCGVSDAVN